MLTLYEFALSGNCHKVRLILSLLGLQYQSVAVNGGEQQQKTAAFIAMNPFVQVPVLTDDDIVIRDSQAILVYLARKYGDDQWLPNEAALLAQCIAWLSTAANELATGPNRLRLHFKFGRTINVDECRQIALNLLEVLQNWLASHSYLVANHITVADIAIYPYIALAPEGMIDLEAYPAILEWLGRIQALPGYIGMPGMWQAERNVVRNL